MHRNHKLLFCVLIAALLVLMLTLIGPARQVSLASNGIIYVAAAATGAQDGTSWTDAYTGLQPALDAAGIGDQIWVAAGSYTPTLEFIPGDPRSASFVMKNGVTIYGGFAGTESSLAERDWLTNVTILSGDLSGNDGPGFTNNSENSYHVFFHFGTDLNNSAVLDGFTIAGGNANDTMWPHNTGGGMLNLYSSPTLNNCIFKSNWAQYGGGMDNFDNAPVLTNCTFSGNHAEFGGGMSNGESSSPVLTNCTFADNTGSGMRNIGGSTPTLTNCIFYRNYGYAVDNGDSYPVLTNCILWGNLPAEIYDDGGTLIISYSDVQGGYPGEAILNLDPLFMEADNANYHLTSDSPCIDAGNNAAAYLPLFDFEGDERILNGGHSEIATVDMGVDEAFWYRIYLPGTYK